MITKMIASAWILSAAAFVQGTPVKPAAPAKPNAITAGETAPSDRARQWLTLVDDGNYTQSWKDAGAAFHKRAADSWSRDALAMRDPLGAVANRALKSIDVSKPHVAVVSYDTAFARKVGAVETVTLTFENGGWVVTDYEIH